MSLDINATRRRAAEAERYDQMERTLLNAQRERTQLRMKQALGRMEETAYGLGFSCGTIHQDECADHALDGEGPAPEPYTNPYPGGHALHAAWRDGWRDAGGVS